MRSKLGIVITSVVIIGLAYMVHREHYRAHLLFEELEALRAATNSLSTELAELQSAHVNAAELERLRADQRESIKLRGELTGLRQQVSNATATAKAAQSAANAAQARAKQ